jgi:hypothetical protein
MRRIALFVSMAGALALPAALWAHGTGNKVMGTVTAVHASMNHIDVKTGDGHTVGIKVNDATKYMKAGKVMAFVDLKEGARVVVTTTGNGDDRTATLVRISSATGKSTAKASATHQHQH